MSALSPVIVQELSRYGIGGSEIASAAGLSRYKSQFALWLEKTGRAPQFAGNVHTRLGTLCEPHARQLYSNATGHSIVTPPCSQYHPRYQWARATPDGIVDGNPKHLVQIKCVGYYSGRRWKYDGLPLEIEAQCQWEMFVADAEQDDVAALVGSDELEWERYILGEAIEPSDIFSRATLEIFPVHRSDDDISILFDRASKFMEMVDKDVQPPIDGSPECARYLSRKAGGTVALDCESQGVHEAVEAFREAYTLANSNDRMLEIAKNRLRQILGDAGANRINTPDGPIQWIVKSNGQAQLRAPSSWSKESHQ